MSIEECFAFANEQVKQSMASMTQVCNANREAHEKENSQMLSYLEYSLHLQSQLVVGSPTLLNLSKGCPSNTQVP